jgi:hypothetical protein
MSELERSIGKVFRRLRIQRFLTTVIWSWGIGLLIVAVILGAEKFLGRSLPGSGWIPFAAAGIVGLLAATVIALFSGPSRLDAAVALDRAFQLDERLSTALCLPDDLKATPAGTALMADASRKVSGLDVGSKFGLRLPRRAWLILIPAGLALILALIPPWEPRMVQARTTANPVDAKEIAKRTQVLTKKIASQRQAIDKQKFPEAEKLLIQVEKKTAELSKAPPGQKDKLMVELNKLSDALKDRQKQLGSPEQLTRQLQQLKEMGSMGPAEEMAKELAKGDYQKAADKIKDIQEKLASGKMTKEEKKALQNQLGEMAKKLNSLANLEERKKQLDQAKKNGALSQQQYEREMDKLREQSQAMQQLKQLASKLGKAQEALQNGNAKKAAEQLGMTQEKLQEMAQQLQEIQSLDSALADIADAKNGILGDGMNQLGDSMMFGMSRNPGDRKGNGQGQGRGRGQGDRPEAEDKTSTYTSQVKQQMGKGKAVFQGFAPPGKAVKGESVIDVQAELDAGGGLDAGALSNQKIPKNVEKHIRSYYDQINKPK